MTGADSRWAFGGVQTPRNEARVVLIPVSYDLTTSYGAGSRHGPEALLQASGYLELFDERLRRTPTDVGVHTMDIIEQNASGPGAMIGEVSDLVGAVLDEGRVPALIGGDHSLSIGAFQALAARKLPVTILQFDAHADLRIEYQGTPYSHACAMARAREHFDCVQIGIRSISQPEYERVRSQKLPLFPIRRIRDRNGREEVIREARGLIGPKVYVTLDLDVLDPSLMPATGTPEPGGLQWDELLEMIRELTENREVIGFDIMELAPIPGFRAPDFLAAKLLNKMIGYSCPPDAKR